MPTDARSAATMDPLVGAAPSGGAAGTSDRPCLSAFPAGLRIAEAEAADGRGRRFRLSDPATDGLWILGAAELAVARQFDGRRGYAEIRGILEAEHRIRIPQEKLLTFEQRLISAGLLRPSAGTRARDPFTGFHYGLLHYLIIARIVSGNPDPGLDALLRRLPWLAGPAAAGTLALLGVGAVALLTARFDAFAAAAAATLTGWAWVWLYLITALSGIIHEGGHALACKAFGVKVREAGFAVHFLMPFAWTRPDREDWERQPFSTRLVAILAGPLASLAMAGVGLAAWLAAGPGTAAADLSVLVTLAGIFGATMTLLPILNGDGYLLLIELFGLPNLRRNSFEYLKALLSGRDTSRLDPMGDRRALYLFVSIGTVLGWIALWTLSCLTLLSIAGRELGFA